MSRHHYWITALLLTYPFAQKQQQHDMHPFLHVVFLSSLFPNTSLILKKGNTPSLLIVGPYISSQWLN